MHSFTVALVAVFGLAVFTQQAYSANYVVYYRTPTNTYPNTNGQTYYPNTNGQMYNPSMNINGQMYNPYVNTNRQMYNPYMNTNGQMNNPNMTPSAMENVPSQAGPTQENNGMFGTTAEPRVANQQLDTTPFSNNISGNTMNGQ